MEYTFHVGPINYSIDTHNSGMGHELFAAANVKLYHRGKLPQKYQKKLERLYAVKETTEGAFENWVWEAFQEHWWEQFKEDAEEQDLGKVYSAGRSGGWLVLDAFHRSRIEQLVEHAQISCWHCKKTFGFHAGKDHHCLFAATCFESADYDETTYSEIEESAALLVKVATFLKKCEDNVRNFAPADFVYNQKFIIDNRGENYRASATAHRVLQAKTG